MSHSAIEFMTVYFYGGPHDDSTETYTRARGKLPPKTITHLGATYKFTGAFHKSGALIYTWPTTPIQL